MRRNRGSSRKGHEVVEVPLILLPRNPVQGMRTGCPFARGYAAENTSISWHGQSNRDVV
jgi:hypothetical protein